MRVQSVHVYPVKATAPVDLASAHVELAGLRDDRRWAVVDPHGARLNAPRHDRLSTVTAMPDESGALTLTGPGGPPLTVPVPVGGPEVPVNVTRLATMIDAGDAAAAWLSVVLGEPVRLVWQDDPARRPISSQHGGLGAEPLSLADTGPLLLTTTSSLAQLEAWIAAEHEPQVMAMQRFRPNVVVDGSDVPFAEDDWRGIHIGDVPYRFAEHCDRCVVTTIDPATLVHGKEPIRTLARHRKWDGKTWFGIRIVPLATGTVSVGDEVTVS
ncbi:MOSC domain-containing protein [Aeromicrobium ginsengisoli]|uniref:MOSC domain-containing protein n=1 Tax=Aeromicrobium ginsengisoli TaxID=363867 RepID=A0A5M4FEX0_9ACTN|nr:MOSC N-terminal beta barrel domain-containing protein [Aeromicrobium ginsengisoli]KAA1397393.1 MOSC domain-containing protein [Aeromicrobium ginsengisoli]